MRETPENNKIRILAPALFLRVDGGRERPKMANNLYSSPLHSSNLCSDDTTPSSPTYSTFYQSSNRSSRPPVKHSKHSVRSFDTLHRPPLSNLLKSSTTTKLRPLSNRPVRVVPEVESRNPYAEAAFVGRGGLRNGEWEEYTDEEERLLDIREGIAARRRDRGWEEQFAERGGEGIASYLAREAQNQFERDPQQGNLFIVHQDRRVDLSMDVEIPAEFLVDDEEYLAAEYAASKNPTFPVPLLASEGTIYPSSSPTKLNNGDMAMDTGEEEPDPPLTGDLVSNEGGKSFAEVVMESVCPCCSPKSSARSIVGSTLGVGCGICGWGIEMNTLKLTEESFTAH